jgi:hypothetical protein
MVQLAGTAIGFLLASYYSVFRIDAVRAKYGSLDLINWFYYVIIAWALLGWAIDVAIWGVQYALWTLDYDDA